MAGHWALAQIWESSLEHAMGGRRLLDILEMCEWIFLSSAVMETSPALLSALL